MRNSQLPKGTRNTKGTFGTLTKCGPKPESRKVDLLSKESKLAREKESLRRQLSLRDLGLTIGPNKKMGGVAKTCRLPTKRESGTPTTMFFQQHPRNKAHTEKREDERVAHSLEHSGGQIRRSGTSSSRINLLVLSRE